MCQHIIRHSKKSNAQHAIECHIKSNADYVSRHERVSNRPLVSGHMKQEQIKMQYKNEMQKIWAREDRKGLKLTYPMDLDPSIWEYHKSTCDVNADDAIHLQQRLNGVFGQQVKLVNAKTGRKFIGHIRKDRIRTEQLDVRQGKRSYVRPKSKVKYQVSNARRKELYGLVVTQSGSTKCRRFDYDDITRIRHNRMGDGTYRMEITYSGE